MKHLIRAAVVALVAGGPAIAQEAPRFFAETYPPYALGPALEAYGKLGGEEAAIDKKTHELISLGVSAQIPCDYCVYAHSQGARAAGATEAEIRDAIASAAAVRQWSTVLNGMNYDLEAFKREWDELYPVN